MTAPAAADPTDATRDPHRGAYAAIAAYLIWGLTPVYFKALAAVGAGEIIAHRVLWSVLLLAIVLLAARRRQGVEAIRRQPRLLLWLTLSAVLVTSNWLVYVWAVNAGRVLEASLGYYINPLVYVLAGVVLLGERLRRLQLVAVVLAALGVVYLTVSGGVFPWAAISLALLFTGYGVIRKQAGIGAMPGLFIETTLLLPFALGWLLYLVALGKASFASGDAGLSGLLMLGGPITVVPLLLFAIAARSLSLTTVGFMQFLAPTLQFLTGLYYGEHLTNAHLVCFACIWAAVVFFSYDAVTAGRKKAPAN